MSEQVFPKRLNVGQLRRLAKELRAAARGGDPVAVERARGHVDADQLTMSLATARLVIAREHGFASWPRLVEQVRVGGLGWAGWRGLRSREATSNWPGWRRDDAAHAGRRRRSVGPREATMPGVSVTRVRAAGPLTVAGVCVALFAAGCGSGQNMPPFNAAAAMSGALRIVACMRSHGVPNMPDPQVFHSGGKSGIVMPDPGSADNSPQFKSAQQACHALKSGTAISNTSQAASALAQRRKQALAFAVCMRSHGVPNFPDPDNQGLFTSKLHASAPQVQAANKACQRTLPTGADPLSGEPTPAP